jgi:hypothetical protein
MTPDTASAEPVGPTHVETVLVLPSGAIHLPGAVITVSGSTEDAVSRVWERGQDAARRLGQPLLLKVGMPNGTVDTRMIIHGVEPTPMEPYFHPREPDARWDHAIPDRSGLLRTIAAAQRAGQFAGAEVAAERLARALRGALGVHPYAVLALELQARCAAEVGHWDKASELYLTAAVARHHLGEPGVTEAANVQEAVTAWLRGARTASSTSAGFYLAHHLLGICPTSPELLFSVLRVLDDQLPAPRQQFVLTESQNAKERS